MQAKSYRVRRATIDDLPQLLELWRENQLPGTELERHFTDFQVAEDSVGVIAAAIGFQISERDGHLHSETFADFGLSDRLRPLLWERVQNLVQNHCLHRLWTRETSPYWKRELGFAELSKDESGPPPAAFGFPEARWLLLRLREEHPLHESVEQAFVLFQEAERARSKEILTQARTLHWIAAAAAVLIVLLVGAGIAYLLFVRPGAAP